LAAKPSAEKDVDVDVEVFLGEGMVCGDNVGPPQRVSGWWFGT
jgi:hypothetical protein